MGNSTLPTVTEDTRRRPVVTKATWAAAFVAFAAAAWLSAAGPRWRSPYPTHTDEWTHLAYAEALVKGGSASHSEPLYGQEDTGFRPELGFRVALAEVRLATGLDWTRLFPALPEALFVLFALGMLYLGFRLGAGPWAGIMALGTPTTVRFLGPALAVPVALGLVLLVALAIALAEERLRGSWALPVIVAALLVALLLAHPLTAMPAAALALCVAGYLAVRGRARRNAPLWASAAVAALAPAAWFLAIGGGLRSELLLQASQTAEAGQGLVRDFVYFAGWVRLALFAVALFAILLWRVLAGWDLRYGALLVAYVALVAFISLHSAGLVPASNLYDRSWLYLDVVLSVTAGLGLALFFGRVGEGGGRLAAGCKRAMPALMVVLAAGIIANAWYARSREPGYATATAAALSDYRWIRQNLGDVPGLTLVDPMVSVVYPAVAGRPVYASASLPKPSPDERSYRALDLLRAPEPDAVALRSEGIGIVYRPAWTGGAGVEQVYPGVFVVRGIETP